MAVVPGKTNSGLAWLLLFLMISTVCLRTCHAARNCSVKGCMIHFGKRIAPELAEPEVQKSMDYQNNRQHKQNVLRLVERILSRSMSSRNSPIDETA